MVRVVQAHRPLRHHREEELREFVIVRVGDVEIRQRRGEHVLQQVAFEEHRIDVDAVLLVQQRDEQQVHAATRHGDASDE